MRKLWFLCSMQKGREINENEENNEFFLLFFSQRKMLQPLMRYSRNHPSSAKTTYEPTIDSNYCWKTFYFLRTSNFHFRFPWLLYATENLQVNGKFQQFNSIRIHNSCFQIVFLQKNFNCILKVYCLRNTSWHFRISLQLSPHTAHFTLTPNFNLKFCYFLLLMKVKTT